MNNRRITVLIGACLVMTAVSGCSSGQKKPETELESLVVEDIEVIDETEYVSDEAEGQETEAMTLDFSDESGESGSMTGQPERKSGVEESTEAENEPETEALTELETEGETAAVSVRKSGESQAKSESELPKQGSKSKRSEMAAEDEAQGQSGTPGQDETQKQSGTSGQREMKEADENRQSDGLQTPTEKSQDESEADTQGEGIAEPETDTQGEGIREPETDTQGEKVREPETDAQGEGDRESEAESEDETEYGAETENETETAFEPVIMLANDRVNVRREPSTDAEALALLTPQSRVLATGLEGEWTAVYYQQEDDSFTTGYIKSEFLDEAGDEVEDALLEEEAQRLVSEAQEAAEESEAQTAEESDAERSTDAEATNAAATEENDAERSTDAEATNAAASEENDAEQSTDAAAAEESDAEQSTDTAASEEDETESEAGLGVPEENDLDSETDAAAMVTNDRVNVRKEPSTDSEALTMLEPGSQISATGSYGEWTAVRCQKEDGSFLDGYIKSEFLDDPADEAASQEDEGPAETSPVTLTLSEGPEAQFELAKALVPEIQKAGVIYSKENKDAEKQLEQYEKLGKAYGIELVSVEIEEEADIDLAASELAGEVDCVFCLEDAVVEQTVQTICAYADEVEIPVFGLTDDQVEQGCAAAYEDGILHWNSDRAQKLGISLPELGSGKVEQH